MTVEKLPPCEGPKLSAFEDHHESVEFLELIGSGAHSLVFKVYVNNRIFALKVFKPFDIDEFRSCIGLGASGRVSDESLIYHSDPFFAECRAYGRIHDKSKRPSSDPIAIPCFGFITISPEKFKVACLKFGVEEWDESESECRQPIKISFIDEPLRALVKEFIDSDTTIAKPAKMLRDLKALRAIGIYPRDVRANNYKNGLLVDFSVALTSPHWREGIWEHKRDVLERWRSQDLFQFDRMIKDEGVRTNARATRNLPYTRKLRNHPYTYPKSSSGGE